jgi:predicted AAA+ superfamily ATPase
MTESPLYERFLRKPLEEALEDTPVVLIHGPRQCGKTTLARMVGDAAGYEYITFDDDVQLAAATADPVRFGSQPTCHKRRFWMRCSGFRACSSR